jgi:hypothetical protein
MIKIALVGFQANANAANGVQTGNLPEKQLQKVIPTV